MYRLRVKVLTKETIRVGRFLGQADIFLNSLKDQTERCGWFPLRPQRSSLAATGAYYYTTISPSRPA